MSDNPVICAAALWSFQRSPELHPNVPFTSRHSSETILSGQGFNFEGWGAFAPDSVKGNFKWFEYEPKMWCEDDIECDFFASLTVL